MKQLTKRKKNCKIDQDETRQLRYHRHAENRASDNVAFVSYMVIRSVSISLDFWYSKLATTNDKHLTQLDSDWIEVLLLFYTKM